MQITADSKDFADAVGLSSTFPMGDMLGRDGATFETTNDFDIEWQVDPVHDLTLFF